MVGREERANEAVTPTQGEPREFREHSRELLDPMRVFATYTSSRGKTDIARRS